jgi:hypothetical protein
VNALDFNALASNFGQNAGAEFWWQGDFNYDGNVNTLDFSALAANFNAPLASSPALGSAVPEPQTLCVFASVWLLGWRRQKQSKGSA